MYIGERGAIPYHLHSLRLIEAAAQRDSEMFWHHGTAIYPVPTIPEMHYALSRVKWFMRKGREQEAARVVSQQLEALLEQYLSLHFSDLPDTEELQDAQAQQTQFHFFVLLGDENPEIEKEGETVLVGALQGEAQVASMTFHREADASLITETDGCDLTFLP